MREKPEEIVSKVRQVEVLQGREMTIAHAVRWKGVTQNVDYWWRNPRRNGRDPRKRLKEMKTQNQRLRRAVSDLISDKLVPAWAVQGNFLRPWPSEQWATGGIDPS